MKCFLYIAVLFFFIACGSDARKKEGQKIVDSIYSFKKENGRYPYSLNEIGMEEKEDGPFYYDLTQDSSNFKIWYGLGLGDSEVYQSKTGTWYGPNTPLKSLEE